MNIFKPISKDQLTSGSLTPPLTFQLSQDKIFGKFKLELQETKWASDKSSMFVEASESSSEQKNLVLNLLFGKETASNSEAEQQSEFSPPSERFDPKENQVKDSPVESLESDLTDLLTELIFGSPINFLSKIKTTKLSEEKIKVLKFFLLRFLFASADKKSKDAVTLLTNEDLVTCVEKMIQKELFKKARHQRMNIILRSVFPHIMKQLKIHKFVINGTQLWHDQLSRERIVQLVEINGVRSSFIELLESKELHQDILQKSRQQFKILCVDWIKKGKLSSFTDPKSNTKPNIRMGILPCDLPIGLEKLKLLFKNN